MSKYKRVSLETLTNAMSNNTVTNKWDVLCSYGIKSLNKVLQEEHKKYLTNTHITFNKLIDSDINLSYKYDIKFGSPTISFNANVDGIYNIKMPIAKGSSFDKMLADKLIKSYEIPQGCYLLASGPVQCIKGEGNTSKHDAGAIIEFGKNDYKASIVLHFGKDLRQIESLIDSDVSSQDDVKSALEKIDLETFKENITDINYNITQVKVNSDKQDEVVLTPKSFIFTTMGSEDNEENGVLNVWIQTNESKNEQGNPKPAFFVDDNLLPIPEVHNASIIFSKQLIQINYFKKVLDNAKLDILEFTSLDPYPSYKPLTGIAMKLSPKGVPEYKKTYGTYDFKIPNDGMKTYESFTSDPLEINFTKSPILLNINTENIHIKWYWNQQIDFKVGYWESAPRIGIVHTTKDGSIKTTGSIDKTFKLKDCVNLDSSKFSINLNIDGENDIRLETEDLLDHSFWAQIVRETIADPGIHKDIKSILSNFLNIELNCESLNYFAEANVLFNEARFIIDKESNINFPGDVFLVGDIVYSN